MKREKVQISNWPFRPTLCVYLVMQGPSQIFKTSVIEEMFRIRFQPNAQFLNTNCPDVWQQVPVTVHKHTAEHAVHHGGYVLPVLPQLKHTHVKNMCI